MPANTRSTRKAKHNDGGKQKEKCYPGEEGSENASASKRSIRETSSKKSGSSTSSSTRRSGRLKSGTQPPNPSKSDTSLSLMDATRKSSIRKKSVNELVVEANHVDQSNTSTQRKKTLPAHLYRDLLRAHMEKVKVSDSANGRRAGPFTSSNSGGCSKKFPVADEDDLNEEGKCGEDYAESTSKSDQGGLENASQEAASEIPNGQNNLELHTRQNPSKASVEVSVTCLKRQSIDGHLPETNLFQDTCARLIQEVHTEVETRAQMDICQNGDVNIGDKGLQLDTEMECEENKCVICKFTGRLLYCGGKGCRRRCHPGCLDSRWEDLYPGIWYCPWCTKNKIKFGAHAVSEGIEFILDVRVQNHEGDKTQKEYFAKYKGLAHAHNCWLPEQQIILEAPELVSEFVQRDNVIPWRQEWSQPHRLLQKRSLMLPKSELCVTQEVGTNNFRHEWLVKWHGLDYNEITWELENAAFLETPKALDLMNEYERRHQKARRSACLHKIQDKEKDSRVEPLTLPSASDTNCTEFIFNLHDHWSKGQNILMIDEQVQAAHIIYFILALQPNVSRPFLVMVPSSSISKWEAEFSFVASSVNTVVYNGNRDARRLIRTLEFYDGPHVMFTVLLSTLDIISEDLDYIKCIRWEAAIVDECLKSEALAKLIFVKEIASGSMILLLIDQINENAIDYWNILSLLDHNFDSCDVEGREVDSNSITLLKEKLSPFTVCGPKSGPSRLVEYWVPVQMSNVQLEQYCSSLLTNLTALCSKSDPVGLLREILISTRKCCDHPYVVEEKLQTRLIQGSRPEDILDIGVEASGKLYFLDTILTKMKDQGQKVVILFKTLGGSGRDIIGDILDDYVRQRFGKDSYERVDGGGVPSRRQASVARFNKEGRFIFLLETRACSSSIKLSSVDAVILFGSDWNPLNDLKALQKIKIDSKFEVKVFRLYTLCSIEEKVLLLSKKSIFLESTVQGIGFSTRHLLLTWGASFLFKKLDEFHDCPGNPEILPRCSILKDVVQEFLSVLQTHGTHMSTKCISSARQNDGGYSTDISLLGELYNQFKDEDQHVLFWTKLLEGRQPRWTYLSLSSQRNRKRVQHYGEASETNAQIDDTLKRQKKNGNTNFEACSPRVGKDVEKEPVSGSYGISPKNGPEMSPNSGGSTASAQKIHAAIPSDKLCAEQKDLHQMLKPDMKRLFQILNLKEDVQQKAEQFLVYVIANQRCWVAASILKEKLDHVESLSLAREHLNFNCKIDDAEFSFSKMQFPMKMFLRSEGIKLQAFSKDLVSGVEGFNVSIHKQKLTHEGFDIEGGGMKSKYVNKIVKSLAKLFNRQSSEEKEHKKLWRERKAKLENNFNLESAVIRSINSSEAVRIDKLKILEANHRQKLEELESEMGTCLTGMKARHWAEREAEEKEGIRKMNDLKSWTENGLFNNLHTKAAEVVPAKSFSPSVNNLEEESSKEHESVGVHVPLLQATKDPHNDAAENSGSAEVAAISADMPCNTSEQAIYIHLPLEPAVPLVSAISHPVDLTQPCSTSCGVPEILLTESRIPSKTPEGPIQEDHRPLNRSVEASPRPVPDAYPPLHNSNQFESYMPSRSLPSSLPASQEFDPLHKEYERICGDSNQVSRNHEDVVLHLKSQCDKEIEELVGQIRRKYESMFHEAEASFLQKKRELEHNQLKVVMNIKLAEAFRCKCIDHRTAPQRAVASTLTHQQFLESHQFNNRRLASAPPLNVNQSTMSQRSTSQTVGSEMCLAGMTSSTLSSVAPNSTFRSQSQPQIYVARPMSLLEDTSSTGPATEELQLQMSVSDQNAAATRSAAAPPPVLLPPLPEIARNFEAWNLTEFEASLDVRWKRQQGLAGSSGVVCLSDDE
ncbi:hypothetical protein V2J09_012219 [Rumex salicifolius]